jgi:hypothetical protein
VGVRRAVPAAALAVAGAGCLAIAGAGWSAGPGEALPDLVPEFPSPPGFPAMANAVVDRTSAPGRVLLRFDAVLRNTGPGRFELAGARADTTTDMAAEQVVYDPAGAVEVRRVPLANPIYWEAADGHRHWHYRRAAEYRLWTPQGPGEREVGPAAKIGFCMFDTYAAGSTGARSYFDCGASPDQLSVRMGIAPTWGDLYPAALALQWIDVTGLAPGPYRLRGEVDPDGQIEEADESDQVAWADTFVDGLVARGQDAGQAPAGGTLPVTLAAEAVNAPTTPPAQRLRVTGFQVVDPPARGTLTPPGPGSAVAVYRPSPGATGPDRFTFRATGPAGAQSAPAEVTLTVVPAPPASPAPSPAPAPPTPAPPAPPSAPAVDPPPAGVPAPAPPAVAAADPLTVRATARGARVVVSVRSGLGRGVVRVAVRQGGRVIGRCVRPVLPARPGRCVLRVARRDRAHLVASAVLVAPRGGLVLARAAAPVARRG